MTALGELSLWLALLMATWGAALSATGGILSRVEFLRSGARGLHAAAAFTMLAAAGLTWALVSSDFAVRYVAGHTSDGLPAIFKFSAFWAGGAGWLLLWNAAFSACATVAIRAKRRVPGVRLPLLSSVLGAALTCLLALSAFSANPFQHLDVVPANGRGLEPQLQDWARVLDAPLFAVGTAAAAIWVTRSLVAFARRGERTSWRAAAGAWPLLTIGALAAGTAARVWWGYVHHGTVPSLSAPFDTPAGAAFFVLLLIAVAATVFVERPRGRVGGSLAIAGAVMMVVGSVAAGHGKQYDVLLRDGETFRANDAWGVQWTFTSQGASRIERPNYLLTAVALLPTHRGVRQPFMSGEVREFYDDLDRERPAPEIRPAIRRSLVQDVYVAAPQVSERGAVLRIRFNPLVSCVWIGGALLLAGRLVAFWPPAANHAATS